jgi:hypothetical protein
MRCLLVLLVGCGRLGFPSEPPTDAATDARTDAGDAMPPEPCPALPGQIFCESFEGTNGLPISAGNVAVVDTRAFRGTHSQYAMTTGASEASWQIGLVLPTITSGDLYARWYTYVPSSITNLQLASVHLVENDLPFHGVIYGVDDNHADVSCSEATLTATSTITVPRDRWVCAQMHVHISDTAGSVDGTIDGQTLPSLDNIDTLPAGGYHNVHCGLYATGFATEPMEVWTDELAIGTQPIDCD